MDCYEKILNVYFSDASLFSVFTPKELIKIIRTATSETRCWIAKALSRDIENNSACAILCLLAGDPDSLVRVEAVDSLSGYINHDAYSGLLKASSDSDELVRAYSAYGIACVGGELDVHDAQLVLNQMLSHETSDRARVGILEALCILGNDSCLYDLLHFFESDDYWVRCAVIHALCEVANRSNCSVLASFVRGLDLSYEPSAVTSALEQLTALLEDLQNDS